MMQQTKSETKLEAHHIRHKKLGAKSKGYPG